MATGAKSVPEITPAELKARLDRQEVSLIDVREPFERDIASIGGESIPLGRIESELAAIPRDRPVVIYCRSGGRSAQAVQTLMTRHGFSNLYNLAGGILRWRQEIDPSLTAY